MTDDNNDAAPSARERLYQFYKRFYSQLYLVETEPGGARISPSTPDADDSSGQIVFAHDGNLGNVLRELVAEVHEISTRSAKDGNGGREGMIAALNLAQFLIERIPGADLMPIVYTLSKLELALEDLDSGSVHAALKPANRAPGRKRDARREEFRRRCTVAAFLSVKCGDDDPFGHVFDVACHAATILGPFVRSDRRPAATRGRHRGGMTFSPRTIRNWCEEHTTAVNKISDIWATDKHSPYLVSVQDEISRSVAKGTLDVDRTIWLRALQPENIERSVLEVKQIAMDELGFPSKDRPRSQYSSRK